MMTVEMMREMLNGLEDIFFSERIDENDGTLVFDVTIDDFAGFNDDWEEEFNDIDEESIDNFIETLEETCNKQSGVFYRYFVFNGFTVKLGWSYFDI